MIMTEIKISYNDEEYTLEELLQKLSSLEEKNKELQSKVNAYAMADAINTTYKKYEEERVKKLINENLNKCCYDSPLFYNGIADTLEQEKIKEMKQAANSLKESISLKEENIKLKKRIDELEEEKTAMAWASIILALMKNNNK